jgi:uncharacterized protein YndB with AHSA1/START domain/DNA-binding transcriptional ArsR family regulator
MVWDRDLAAGDIAAAFSVTKPTVSQHLAVLRTAGLVTVRVIGTSRRYRARQNGLRGLRGAISAPGKWRNADDVPERELADTRTVFAAVASTDVPTGQYATFTAFTDPVIYSRWLGVPVTIDDGNFACTMEWGTRVRGRYQLVCPPELIVMHWDFDDDNIPVPGGELTGYLRISPHVGGAHVEVHQLADTLTHAQFMESAWAMVLGRLKAGVAAATSDAEAVTARLPRPKQHRRP